jgi:periplasmic glucans biosynthesis protein
MAFNTALSPRQRMDFMFAQRNSLILIVFCLSELLSSRLLAADSSSITKAKSFGFDNVCAIAEQRLAKPMDRRVRDLPCELVGLDYDSWRYIAYEGSNTIWRKEDFPFQAETGHRGYLFTQRVQLNEVKDAVAAELPFNPHAFEYRGWLNGYRFPRTLGHSGWKLLGKFNDERHDAERKGKEVFVREVGSFLGASYFRLLGSQHVYGSSIRGLAVDCAMPHPEEFPVFTEFWLERPSNDSQSFRCWALLESERVLGAYQFDITPDVNTIVDVKAKLFVRGKIDKLGIAPLTSMWMWGSGTKPPLGDSRPEVHDSDGLLVLGSDDSKLWRPLSRPKVPIVNHYAVPGLRAFGLVQRNRDPEYYADSEALYHRRPTILIEPKEAWPAGGVELLRLPAAHEGIDNIGAFYLLQNPPQDGQSIEVEYRIHICDDDKRFVPSTAPNKDTNVLGRARFVQSSITQPQPGLWEINLTAEVSGTVLEGVDANSLTGDSLTLWNESGHIVAKSVQKTSDAVKVNLQVQNEPQKAFELLLRLGDGKQDLTEMWSYRCEP